MKTIITKACRTSTTGVLMAAGVLLTMPAADAVAQQTRKFQKIAKKQAKKANNATVALRMATNRSLPGNSMNYFPDMAAGGWLHTSNSTYTYTTDGKLTERIDVDPVTSDNLSKETTTYDSHGNHTETLYHHWATNTWEMVGGHKNQYTYNSNNQIIDEISSYYDSFNGTFKFDGRTTTTYNANGLIESETESYWDDSNWITFFRYKYNYGAGNEINEVIMQDFDAGTFHDSFKYTDIVWHNMSKFEIISATGYEWDGNSWELSERANISYDQYGGSVSVWEFYENGTWIPEWRETVMYDSHLNYTGEKGEMWNGMNWEIQNQAEEELTYNTTFDVTERIFRYTIMDPAILEDRRKEVYSNFIIITAKPELISQLPVAVYPNPAQHNLTISSNLTEPVTVTFTDLTGRTMLTRNMAMASGEIEIGHLPAGTYLVHITSKQGNKTTKIVKQ